MKKVFKILLVVLFVGVTVACQKNVSKVSYTAFNEYFSSKDNFSINDDTSSYDINVRKYIQAVTDNYQIYYIEYDSEKNANKYIDSLKEESDDYKIEVYDNYTYAVSKKGRYMVLYKVDETIVVGMSNNEGYKSEINGILKDLGY